MTINHITIEPVSGFRGLWRERRRGVCLTLALLGGLLVRLTGVNLVDVWPQEAQYLWEARQGGGEFDLYPLFTFLLRVWQETGMGEPAAFARLLPMVCGLSAAWAAFVLISRLIDRSAGVAAAVAITMNPLLVIHSQEIRPHILGAGAALWPLYFLVRGHESRRYEYWFLYAAAAAAALYAAPLNAAVLLGGNVWFLVALRAGRQLGPWFAGNALAVAMFSPQLVRVWDAKPWLGAGRAGLPVLETARDFLTRLCLGYFEAPGFELAAWLTLGALTAAGAGLAAARGWRKGLFLLCAMAAPSLVCLWLMARGFSLTAPDMLPAGLLFLMTAGAGIAVIPTPHLRAFTLTALSGALVFLHVASVLSESWKSYPRDLLPRFSYGPAARHIAEAWREGDVIIHADGSTLAPFRRYLSPDWPQVKMTAGVFDRAAGQFAPPANAHDTGDEAVQEIEPAVRLYRRVWLALPTLDPPSEAELAGKVWMDCHWFETGRGAWPGICLYRYEREIDGLWTRLTHRLTDDGAAAQVVYTLGAQGIERPYLIETPDFLLAAPGREEPAGPLRVAFEPEPSNSAALIALTNEKPFKRQSFSVTNRGAAAARIRIGVAATSQLIDTASMIESVPESAVWRLAQPSQSKEDGKAWDTYYPAAYMTAALGGNGEERAELLGSVALEANSYMVYLGARPTGGLRADERDADLQVFVRGAPLRGAGPALNRGAGWQWAPCGSFQLPAYDGRATLVLSASLPEGAAAARAAAAYIAFAPAADSGGGELETRRYFDTFETRVEAGATRFWMVKCAADLERLDVWVCLEGDAAAVYRIFCPLE